MFAYDDLKNLPKGDFPSQKMLVFYELTKMSGLGKPHFNYASMFLIFLFVVFPTTNAFGLRKMSHTLWNPLPVVVLRTRDVNIISINVGGKIFETYKETLMKYDSILKHMVRQERFEVTIWQKSKMNLALTGSEPALSRLLFLFWQNATIPCSHI